MTRQVTLFRACCGNYGAASPRVAWHAKDLVFYSDGGMLCCGEEPGIAALTPVGVKFEYAQQEALPNTSPSGSVKLFRTTKRTKGPKGYVHSVRVPRAINPCTLTRRPGNPTRAPRSSDSDAPKMPPKSNTRKGDKRAKICTSALAMTCVYGGLGPRRLKSLRGSWVVQCVAPGWQPRRARIAPPFATSLTPNILRPSAPL